MNSKITYHKDYYFSNLYLMKENYKNDYQIGKYGHLRLQYLKEHKILEGILRKYIIDTDPLKWTGLMNNYKYSVEEILFFDIFLFVVSLNLPF